MASLNIEPTGTADFGSCPCCGHNSRRVWGLVGTPTAALAADFVHWTLSRVPDHGAHFDLIIGRWGEKASARGRVLVALEYRLLESGPSVMVIDAGDREAAASDLVGRAPSRKQVIGKPIARKAFAIVDALLAQDPRIAELLGKRR